MPFPTSHRGEPPGSGHLGVVQATIQLLHYYYIPSIKKLNKRSEEKKCWYSRGGRSGRKVRRARKKKERKDRRGRRQQPRRSMETERSRSSPQRRSSPLEPRKRKWPVQRRL